MKKVLKIYWPIIKAHWGKFSVLVGILVIVTVLESSVPFYFSHLANGFSEEFSASSQQQIVGALQNLLITYSVIWVLWRFFEFVITRFETLGLHELDVRCFQVFQAQSLDFFQNSFVGSLTKKAGRLVRAFETIMDWFFFWLIANGVQVLLTLVIFFFAEPFFGALFLLWMVLFLGGNIWFSVWKMKYEEDVAKADSKVGAAFADAISNIFTLKSCAQEEEEEAHVKAVSFDLLKKRAWSWTLQHINFAVQGFLMMGIELLLIFFMYKKWENGDFSVGEFVFFQSFLLVLMHRLWEFGRSLRNLFGAFADAQEMADIFEMNPAIQDIPHAKTLHFSRGKIEFQEVCFSYPNQESQFENFSLSIPAGQKVAIVGHSGAGKTTLLKLLFRFFDIDSGKICIDGQNIAEGTQKSLRSQISLVPQQPELFHRSIRENISFGIPNALEEDIRSAAEKAQALEFIDHLPGGLSALVGERGIKLSGGERQRIALARSFLQNAQIVVLDEATSALDSITERKIQRAIFELMKGRTAVVIAHRLSTILQMDRILVVENGKICEDGTHRELVAKNGLYANMWKHQVGGFLGE